MRMCLNRKVIVGLAAVALGVLVVDPHLFTRILPLLFFAICPLSMVFMMWGMRKTGVMQRMSGNGQSCGMASGAMGTGSMDMGHTDMDMGQPGVASPGPATEDEVVRLRAEVDQLRAERATTT
ncbi:MAG: hypothetical protein ACYCST_09090 [Acidimicrobiales bacterium]